MTDRLLMAREVADLFGVRPDTIIDWHEQGTLPAIRLGGGPRGRLRWRESDVMRTIDAWDTARQGANSPVQVMEIVKP